MTNTMSDEADSVAPPSSVRAKSQPPPLPEGAAQPAPARAAADAAFADRMFDRLAASDYAGALIAAETLLDHQPLHADALDCAQMARAELRRLYLARLGSLERVPRVKVGPRGLLALPLDFRAGFLLSRVDELTTLADIVERTGLPELEALRILSELYLQRIITLD